MKFYTIFLGITAHLSIINCVDIDFRRPDLDNFLKTWNRDHLTQNSFLKLFIICDLCGKTVKVERLRELIGKVEKMEKLSREIAAGIQEKQSPVEDFYQSLSTLVPELCKTSDISVSKSDLAIIAAGGSGREK